MKLFKQRVLPAIIFLLVIVAFTVPCAIWGKNHYEARIIGYIFASLLMGILAYEIFKSFGLNLTYSLILSFVAVFMVFMPIQTTELTLKKSPNNLTDLDLFNLIKKTLFNWENFFILSIISVSFLLIELTNRVNMTYADRFIRLFHVWFALFFIINSIIFLLFILIKDWRMFVFVLGAPSLSDIGGFFGGKFFGHKWIKTPFAPNVSPKKTWEGFIIGTIICYAFSAGMIFGLGLMEKVLWAQSIVLLLTPFLAVGGDLYFSYLKRLNAVKDYSKVLKGHGGFTDRFDSVCFVGSFVAMIYLFI
ncbi:phosphatidate cytidylyltransferase [Mycoplasmopsis primatum]|uniref:phosphatidate cytidylyltransferase n=1 Tax=Mycoplasmopsis primatum TaxID=55604 RepID=UPI0004980B00|nr:phosphatidate cytidylyltransferase [Mycoplasmopsis primatum]